MWFSKWNRAMVKWAAEYIRYWIDSLDIVFAERRNQDPNQHCRLEVRKWTTQHLTEKKQVKAIFSYHSKKVHYQSQGEIVWRRGIDPPADHVLWIYCRGSDICQYLILDLVYSNKITGGSNNILIVDCAKGLPGFTLLDSWSSNSNGVDRMVCKLSY